MKKITSYIIAVVCFFMLSSAEAAVFNVTNVTELQDALSAAQSNRQDDTWLFDCQRTIVNDVLNIKSVNDVLNVVKYFLRYVIPTFLDP